MNLKYLITPDTDIQWTQCTVCELCKNRSKVASNQFGITSNARILNLMHPPSAYEVRI